MGSTCRFYVDLMALHSEVTGSSILCTIKFPNGTTKKVLVDCGLFQESEHSKLNTSVPFNASEIDYVFVTHNHIDHIGRLPLLVQKGYRGDIFMSHDTSVLIPLALEDSYKILRSKAKTNNEPQIYSETDVEETLKHVKSFDYEKSNWLDQNIKVTMFKNGHLPGAAIFLFQIKYKDTEKNYENINLLFTGDYNNQNLFFDVPPIPKWVHQLPITVVQEATYGEMSSEKIEYVFENDILLGISQGKEIVIPVFSLGRAQEILFVLRTLQSQKKLDKSIPIYLDGKLARRYTNIYLKGILDIKEECLDFMPENFSFVDDSDMRRSIMNDGVQKIILTTSGMGSYGPAQTYLPEYLRRPNALIHFTGYCAEGTLGRRLYDSEIGNAVDIAGLKVKKAGDVKFTSEFSAHAKNDGLLSFLQDFECLNYVLINHGTTASKDYYAGLVLDEINPKGVAVISRDYIHRIDAYGLVKPPMSSKIL